jgi:hypothetical protein
VTIDVLGRQEVTPKEVTPEIGNSVRIAREVLERRFVPRTTPAVRGSTTVAMTIIQSFVLLLLWAAALAYAAYRGYKIFITLLVRA